MAPAPVPSLVLAHPITQPHVLAVPPLLAGVLAGLLVFSVALVLGARPGSGRAEIDAVASWSGRLTRVQVVTRCAALVVLVLAVTAGWFGVDDELENIAPALVIGVVWPLLVLASILAGGVWRWLDPWDALARLLTGGAPADAGDWPSTHVWPAVPLAFALVWYLGAYEDTLDPRSVGAALAVYTVVASAGCVAFGRVRWLSSGEPVGITLTWISLLPRRGLTAWRQPRGAEVLLGVLSGGLLFGLVRRSVLWGDLGASAHPTLVATAGLVVACAAVAGLFVLMRHLARGPDGASGVGRAVVPALAGIAVAVAMARNRLTTSAQLMPGLVGDPYGLGWDLFGVPTEGLRPAPLGTTGLLAAQLVVLLVGCLAGSVVLARGLGTQARPAGAVALSLLTATAVTVVAAR